MFQGHILGQNNVRHWENKGLYVFLFFLSLGSLRPAREPNLDLCSFQELPYPCSLQGLGETASDLLDEKQGFDLSFQSFFLSDIFRALERKELASPLFIFLTGAAGRSEKQATEKEGFCQVFSPSSVFLLTADSSNLHCAFPVQPGKDFSGGKTLAFIRATSLFFIQIFNVA